MIRAFVIVAASFIVAALLALTEPVRSWRRALSGRGASALILILVMAAPFLGGARDATDTGDPVQSVGAVRIARILLLAGLLCGVAFAMLRDSRGLRRAGPAAWGMLLYAVFAMASSAYSVEPVLSLYKGFEVFVLVLAVIHLSGRLETLADIQWLLNVLWLILLYLTTTALFGAVLMPSVAFSHLEESSSIVLQGAWPVINSNTLTQFSASVVLVCLTWSLQRITKTSLIVWVIGGFAAVAMILAHSRTSLAGCIICATAILFFSKRRGLAVLLASLCVCAALFSQLAVKYFVRGQSQEVFMSMSGRTEFWQGVWELFLRSPLIGHGFYAAQRVLLGVSSVDNTYLEVLLGLGILGFLIFTAPLFMTAFGLARTIPGAKAPPRALAVWLQLMSLFLLIVVRSFTGPSFQVMHPNLSMYMLVVVSVAALRRQRMLRPVLGTSAGGSSPETPMVVAQGGWTPQRPPNLL